MIRGSGSSGICAGIPARLSVIPAHCVSVPESQGRVGLVSELVVPDFQPEVSELRLVGEPLTAYGVDQSDELLAGYRSDGEMGRKAERHQPNAGLHAAAGAPQVFPPQQAQLEPYVAWTRRTAFNHQRQSPEAGQNVVEFAAALGLKHGQRRGMQAARVFRKGGIRERAAAAILQFDAGAENHFALLRVARVCFGVRRLCTLPVIVSTNYEHQGIRWFQMEQLGAEYFGLRKANKYLVHLHLQLQNYSECNK